MHKSLPEKDEIHTPHCFTATINIMQALFLINYNKPYQRSTFGISQPNIPKVIYIYIANILYLTFSETNIKKPKDS